MEDLTDFYKDSLELIIENCRKPPKVANAVGTLVNQNMFFVGAKSQMRLIVAADAVKYYAVIDRPITPMMMNWNTLKSFQVQIKALCMQKKDEDPSVPIMKQTMSIIKWVASFKLHLMGIIGARNCPIIYVIHPMPSRAPLVPMAAPPLLADKPHSEEHGSVEGEMIARLSHADKLFRTDNQSVFEKLDKRLRGTTFQAAIVTFRRLRDRRGAMSALLS